MRVKRSSRELREALRHPVFAGAQSDETGKDARTPTAEGPTPADLHRQAVATHVLQYCELANAYWRGTASFEAAAFLIMLDIFRHDVMGKPVAVTDACIASQAPMTSALRSIDRLIAAGIVVRRKDPGDARRKLLSLTERGFAQVGSYLDSISREMAEMP